MNQTWRTRYLTAWLLISIISYSVRSNNCKRDSIWHSYMKLSLNYSHVHQAHCTSIYGAIYKLKCWKSQLQVGNWMETSYRHLESGEPHINTLILKRKPNHTSVHHRECTQSKTITVAVQNLWKLRKAKKKKKKHWLSWRLIALPPSSTSTQQSQQNLSWHLHLSGSKLGLIQTTAQGHGRCYSIHCHFYLQEANKMLQAEV